MVGKRGDWYYNFWKDQAPTRRGCGAAPPGRATSPTPPNGTSCWTWTRWPRPRGSSGFSMEPLSCARLPANATAWRWWRSPPTAVTPTATASSTSTPAPSWMRPPAVSTSRRRRGTSRGWMRIRCWSPPQPWGCPRRLQCYARTAVTLRRGEALAAAPRLFEIPEDHMLAVVAHDSTPGFERTFAVDYIDFHNRSTFLRAGESWLEIEAPTDVNLSAHREWLLFRPQRDWAVGGSDVPGRFTARRQFRRLPRRVPGPLGAVHPGRAHLAAVMELDAELPAPKPPTGRILRNPGAQSNHTPLKNKGSR